MTTYFVETEYGSESDADVIHGSQSQEFDEQSHVHFSLDISYKVMCEVSVNKQFIKIIKCLKKL